MKLESAYALASANGVKALVYGGAGAGKTYLISTAPAPLILSAESGLLTLKKVIAEIRLNPGYEQFDIPAIPIDTYGKLVETHAWLLAGGDNWAFKTICLDSISEISEVLLKEELILCGKDPRKAYGELATKMTDIIRKFRDLQNRNVYFTSKEISTKDDLTGMITTKPMLPGQQLGLNISYFFDLVAHLYVAKDAQGISYRALRTEQDLTTTAKDRSGFLDPVETNVNLNYIFAKMMNVQP